MKQRRTWTTWVVIIAAFATFSFTPSRARALDTWEWVAIGVASYFAFLVTATKIAYSDPAPIAPDGQPLPEKDQDQKPVEFGNKCAQSQPGFVVACW